MRAWILVCLLISSCSYSRVKEAEAEPSEDSLDMPLISGPIHPAVSAPPVSQALSRPSGELAIGDILDISIFGEEELAGTHVAIAPDGRLYYAFLNGIPAAGKNVAAVKKEVEKALSHYLVHPQVAIEPLYVHIKDETETSPTHVEFTHLECTHGSDSIAIEVSQFPSDEELAYKIFEQTKQRIKDQAARRDLYRLKINDQLSLAIYGEPSTRRHVKIGPAGDIPFLFLNPIPAKGRTIPELRDAIQEQLKSHYQYPLVLITFHDK